MLSLGLSLIPITVVIVGDFVILWLHLYDIYTIDVNLLLQVRNSEEDCRRRRHCFRRYFPQNASLGSEFDEDIHQANTWSSPNGSSWNASRYRKILEDSGVGEAQNPPSHQKMVFSGKVLEDSRTIQDCRIVDGCSIYLVINAGREAVQIKIRHLCGDPFRVTVDRRWTTIATIKQYIKHTLQVPLESQVLLRSGMIMSNEQTLNSIAYQKTDTSFFLVPYSLEDLNASATKQIQLREQKARSNRAALLIQKWWRGISAKLKEKKRQLASTYIQSWFRGYLGKIRLNLAVSTIKAKQHARLREVLRVWRWHAVRRAFELWRRACCARTTVDDDDDDDKEEEEEEEEEEEADLLLREEELMEKEMKSHSSIYIQSCSSGEYTGGVKLKIAVDEMKRRMVSTGEAAAMIRIIQQQWLLLLLLLLHNQLFKFTCRNLAREARSVLLKCLNSTILDFEEREECIQAALYRIQHNIPKYAAAWYYRTAGELESSRPLLLSVTSVNNEETGCDLGCDVAFLSCIYRDHGTLIYSEKSVKLINGLKLQCATI